MMQINKYVINIDDLLFDAKGHLNNGVIEFIQNLDKNNDLMIISHKDRNSGLAKLAKLNKILNSHNVESVTPTYGAYYNGALIVSNGVMLSSLEPIKNAYSVVKAIHDAEPSVEIKVYSSSRKAIIAGDNALKTFFSYIKQNYRFDKNLSLIHIDDFESVFENDSVLYIFSKCANSQQIKNIKNALSKMANVKISSDGNFVAVNPVGKEVVISKILGKDLRQVAYIGTHKSDIEAMKACGVSIAFSKDLDVLNTADFAVESVDEISDVLDAVSSNNDALIASVRSKSALCLKNTSERIANKNTRKTKVSKPVVER